MEQGRQTKLNQYIQMSDAQVQELTMAVFHAITLLSGLLHINRASLNYIVIMMQSNYF